MDATSQTSTPDEVRPLTSITGIEDFPSGGAALTPESIVEMTSASSYSKLQSYFSNYPPRSFLLVDSRAVLFSLIRIMRPKVVVEIGTLFAGTTEVMARALWENGEGVIHSTDPYGADRCPTIISAWPEELQRITHFHPLSSMDFFQVLESQRAMLDFVLVDGHHDYEFALFDLQMAARLLRPGGIIVMDNAEMTGPFRASREFVAGNPAWREIGLALAEYDPVKPFDASRASVAGTTFMILQAPPHLSIGSGPRSWGQARTEMSIVDRFSLDLPSQVTAGTLYYQAALLAYADGNRAGTVSKSIGSIRLNLMGPATVMSHALEKPLSSNLKERYDDAFFMFEIDLSWQPDPGAPALALGSVPSPIAQHR